MLCCAKSRSPDTPWSWVICISATLIVFLHYGFAMCFGVFLPVLSEYFHENREKTAWAGSMSIAFTMFSGIFAVPLVKRFGHRATAMGGGLVCALSLLSSSFVNNLRILYFSYGVIYGVSAGITLNASLTLNNLYFKKNPALPAGIITMGSSIGLIVFGPCVDKLIEVVQWRNTFRIMGGLMSLICVFATTYDPVRIDRGYGNQSETALEQSRNSSLGIRECLELFGHRTYTIGLISSALVFLGFYVPFIHLVQFAKDMNISSRDASQLFIYLGLCSCPPRIVIGKILDKGWISTLRCLQLMALMIGLSIICLTFAKQYSHFVVFSVVYGLCTGGFIANNVVFLLNAAGCERSHISLSVGYMFLSIAMCGGSPFAGFIADELGSYIPSFYIAGGIVTFAAIFPFVLLFCDNKGGAEYTPDRVNVPYQEDSDQKDPLTSKNTTYTTSV